MTHPFERILLATEHSDFDTGSERIAFEMAHRCDVPLAAVVPIVSNPEYEIIAPQLAVHAEQEAAGRISKLQKNADAAGVKIEVVARRGEEPYWEVILEAKERKTDLIIVRRRGKRSFLSNLLVGEMVSKITGHAPCSVLFVPRAAQMWTSGVLAAVDTSKSANNVATVAAKVAKQCGLPLILVSVAVHDANIAEAERAVSRAVAIAQATGVSVQSRILVGKPFEQILDVAKIMNTDLIVVGRHGESNVIHTPFGGTTHKIVGLFDKPVLVVRG